MRPILVICGPTCSGKSGLALRLAQAAPEGAEIVSADSVQVYRGLDVGSAKPSASERAAVPHHLIDRVGLEAVFDAGRFVEEADAAIAAIRGRGRWPIVVGGTGMYLRALLYGLLEAGGRDAAVRSALEGRVAAEGAPALHRELAAVDPATAARVHPNDAVRIVRALEVWQVSGVTMGAMQQAHAVKERAARYEAIQVALAPPREALYADIDARVERMVAAGFIEEVQALLAGGADPDCQPLQTLGYGEVVGFVLGRPGAARDVRELVRRVQRDHRRYAKRQLSWFRAQRDLVWFEDAASAARWIVAQGRDGAGLEAPLMVK